MEPLSIYFHWPYCLSKCPYCDFFKKVEKNAPQQKIIEDYKKELTYYHTLIPNRIVRSIFFGGGTPSLMDPKYVQELIEYALKLWPFEQNIEISLEANPNSQHTGLFTDLKNAGINRLSLGVQALNDDDLKFLGRTHNLKQALQSIDDVLTTFENHSMDLIYARPKQNLQNWSLELGKACRFGFKHLSLYQLTIEDGTVFAKRGIKALGEEEATQMYLQTVDFLRTHGYPRYEVSNFAPKAYQSTHNKCYWQGDDYIGIGESAHGRLKIDGRFYAFIFPHQKEDLNPSERAEELILVGLRLEEGIDKNHFEHISNLKLDKFINQTKLQMLCENGFLDNTESRLKATDKGFLILDRLALELCS